MADPFDHDTAQGGAGKRPAQTIEGTATEVSVNKPDDDEAPETSAADDDEPEEGAADVETDYETEPVQAETRRGSAAHRIHAGDGSAA